MTKPLLSQSSGLAENGLSVVNSIIPNALPSGLAANTSSDLPSGDQLILRPSRFSDTGLQAVVMPWASIAPKQSEDCASVSVVALPDLISASVLTSAVGAHARSRKRSPSFVSGIGLPSLSARFLRKTWPSLV